MFFLRLYGNLDLHFLSFSTEFCAHKISDPLWELKFVETAGAPWFMKTDVRKSTCKKEVEGFFSKVVFSLLNGSAKGLLPKAYCKSTSAYFTHHSLFVKENRAEKMKELGIHCQL